MTPPLCRSCDAPLSEQFLDLGSSPLANSYLTAEQLLEMEPFYPLVTYVCGECLLVQLPAAVAPESIFTDYAYFSSFSDSWVEHARRYVESAIGRFTLGRSSLVVEIASNDGYLLQFFAGAGIPVLGIEPAANVAAAAEKKGIPTAVRFFDARFAAELRAQGRQADLIIGNNVLAHVPDLNGFIEGLRILLAPGGTITIEVPHLLELIRHSQFDTIYHEHFSYFSLHVLEKVFSSHGLRIFDVEQLGTHGGSIRIYAAHEDRADRSSAAVGRVLGLERDAALDTLAGHGVFAPQVHRVKRDLLEFLIDARRAGLKVAGYGAPAKGNTLLNYCGIRTDFVDFTVDRSPHKQGRFLPGSRIPILAPDALDAARPDLLLILPWNLREEIVAQTSRLRTWGGKWVVAVPALEVIE